LETLIRAAAFELIFVASTASSLVRSITAVVETVAEFGLIDAIEVVALERIDVIDLAFRENVSIGAVSFRHVVHFSVAASQSVDGPDLFGHETGSSFWTLKSYALRRFHLTSLTRGQIVAHSRFIGRSLAVASAITGRGIITDTNSLLLTTFSTCN